MQNASQSGVRRAGMGGRSGAGGGGTKAAPAGKGAVLRGAQPPHLLERPTRQPVARYVEDIIRPRHHVHVAISPNVARVASVVPGEGRAGGEQDARAGAGGLRAERAMRMFHTLWRATRISPPMEAHWATRCHGSWCDEKLARHSIPSARRHPSARTPSGPTRHPLTPASPSSFSPASEACSPARVSREVRLNKSRFRLPQPLKRAGRQRQPQCQVAELSVRKGRRGVGIDCVDVPAGQQLRGDAVPPDRSDGLVEEAADGRARLGLPPVVDDGDAERGANPRRSGWVAPGGGERRRGTVQVTGRVVGGSRKVQDRRGKGDGGVGGGGGWSGVASAAGARMYSWLAEQRRAPHTALPQRRARVARTGHAESRLERWDRQHGSHAALWVRQKGRPPATDPPPARGRWHRGHQPACPHTQQWCSQIGAEHRQCTNGRPPTRGRRRTTRPHPARRGRSAAWSSTAWPRSRPSRAPRPLASRSCQRCIRCTAGGTTVLARTVAAARAGRTPGARRRRPSPQRRGTGRAHPAGAQSPTRLLRPPRGGRRLSCLAQARSMGCGPRASTQRRPSARLDATRRGQQGGGRGVVDPGSELGRAEPAEDHRVDRPEPCARQHCHKCLGHHRHVDDDAVALADSPAGQSRG
eukprot:scaffold10897_cov102-Isochrysis_galbana.AAC.4